MDAIGRAVDMAVTNERVGNARRHQTIGRRDCKPRRSATWSPYGYSATASRRSTQQLETNLLWEQYFTTRSIVLRNELVERHLFLIKEVIWTLPDQLLRLYGVDELQEDGVFGLIHAIDHHAPAASEPQQSERAFKAYAKTRIRGSIFDELRRLDWLSRSIRRRVKEFERCKDDLRASQLRNPSDSDVIEALGTSRGRRATETILASRNATPLSLDSPKGPDRNDAIVDRVRALVDEETETVERLDYAQVRNALGHLDSRTRTIIEYRYLEDHSQRKVAALLGLSDARVSQIEKSALRDLRRRLAI